MTHERFGWSIEVQSRPPGTKDFFPVRIRWVVERSDAWHGRCRRISIGYKRRIDSRETMIQVSHTSASCSDEPVPANYRNSTTGPSEKRNGQRKTRAAHSLERFSMGTRIWLGLQDWSWLCCGCRMNQKALPCITLRKNSSTTLQNYLRVGEFLDLLQAKARVSLLQDDSAAW